MSTIAGVPVSGSVASATTIGPYQPFAKQPFNVVITGSFVATVELQRSVNGGTYVTVSPPTLSAIAAFTAPASFSVEEPDPASLYQLNVTGWTSGTITGQMG